MRYLLPALFAAAFLAIPPQAAMAQGQGDFKVWLEGVRAEALAAGISAGTVDAALSGLAPLPRVIELDRRQPETRMTLATYLERVVSDTRIENGLRRLAQHRPLLEEVAAEYGVPARFIVALWGIETSYGGFTGDFPVVAALATLAHDGRRSAYFRGELLKALRILDEGHISLDEMTGSWAGAMGQSQFMPSSFVSFAVDHDGDGRRDIWSNEADVFASIANYLARSGWRANQTWGRQVRLPTGFDRGLIGGETIQPLSTWQALGVRRADGRDLPNADIPAAIVQPDGAGTPAYVVYDNFRTLMRWNRSTYFGIAVGLLADRLRDG